MREFMNTRSAIKRCKKRGETIRSPTTIWIMTFASAVTFALPLVVQYLELRLKLAAVQQSMAGTGIIKPETEWAYRKDRETRSVLMAKSHLRCAIKWSPAPSETHSTSQGSFGQACFGDRASSARSVDPAG
jgi:hypothetical protein